MKNLPDWYLPVQSQPGPNLVQQLDAAPFCENYKTLYFDAKHSEKGLNRGTEISGALFFLKKKGAFFGQYWILP